uniref:Uncharacterized protein n=1 Tax=Uncultured archaeon GZfos26G2 TaxID=3386331 RepID=Q648G9_UNCAG|nr:hypothetical protein GZ37D1_55 [uncultured archaeon GZfos37D1]
MVKVSNIFGDVYSGQAGKAGVFAHWKGRQYRRKYVVPSNPNTAKQQGIRTSFTNAVDKWHAFLSAQRKAYGYMATGLTMSGFNLEVSRWQKMSSAERAAYVDPYMGMKQIGSNDLTSIVQIDTVEGQAEYSTEEKPLGLGQTVFTKASSGIDPNATIEVNRGRVNIPENRTGALTISYESLGRVITDEALKTDPAANDILYTEYWPIDYKTVTLKLATVEVDAIEVDITAGKFYFTDTTPTGTTGKIDCKDYTKIDGAKLELRKVDTNFVTWRDYSDANGIIVLAQTSEDGNRDSRVEMSGYQPEINANLSALNSAKDEYIKLVAT